MFDNLINNLLLVDVAELTIQLKDQTGPWLGLLVEIFQRLVSCTCYAKEEPFYNKKSIAKATLIPSTGYLTPDMRDS